VAAFDASGKRSFHLYARAWAEWILEQEGLEIEAELSGEFQVIARTTDVLLQVRDKAGKRFLVLIELQTRYDSYMPLRLAAYTALAREKYHQDVYVTALYLLPPPEGVAIVEFHHSEFNGQVSHQDFDVIRLWELDAEEALALNNPFLLPFVPLMEGGDTPETLRMAVARIRRESEPEELEILLGFFATLVMDADLVKQMTRWSMQIIRESPLYQELMIDLDEARAQARARGLEEGREQGLEEGREQGLEEGREQGLEEGREQGLEEGREAALQILRRFLAYRFQIAETHFDEPLQWLGLAAIKRLSDAMIDAASLADFEAVLQQLVAQEKQKHEQAENNQPLQSTQGESE
jgi:predicted transposase YdaD